MVSGNRDDLCSRTYVVEDIRSDLLSLSWTLGRIFFLSSRHGCPQGILFEKTDCRWAFMSGFPTSPRPCDAVVARRKQVEGVL